MDSTKLTCKLKVVGFLKKQQIMGVVLLKYLTTRLWCFSIVRTAELEISFCVFSSVTVTTAYLYGIEQRYYVFLKLTKCKPEMDL